MTDSVDPAALRPPSGSAPPDSATPPVVMAWSDDGSLTAESPSEDTESALSSAGFSWNPGRGAFTLPSGSSAGQAPAVQDAGRRLAAVGVGLVVRNSPSPRGGSLPGRRR